ncbi:MAG TPA: hypothetical protein VGN97_01140 [Mesorhizobium sp.]|jgi:hypothetical protein|nr:hypothetical protein [Mesorhizobium sp.]
MNVGNRAQTILLAAALAAVLVWLVYDKFYRPDFAAPGEVNESAPMLR